MRPVNLIPKEERPGGRKPMRAGPLAYILIAGLAIGVIALTALVVENGKVSDRKAEVARLQSEKAGVEAKASSLASYSEFANIREQRNATVTELANSRFDWEKVLSELALVMPADVKLTSLVGSVSPTAAVGGGIGMRSAIPGPALEIAGCAPSQPEVANFIEDLKSIDGVTRVGTPSAGFTSSGGGGGGEGATAGTCPNDWAQFQMVAGFDAAPVAPIEVEGEIAAPETSESSEGGESEESSSEPESTSTASSEEPGAN
jgi:Tfp pilus assembly protein PilN